jgi:hypothetical protein
MQGMVLENLIGPVGILEAARGEYNGVYIIIIIMSFVCRARARNETYNLFFVFFCSGFLDSIFSSVYGVYSRVDKK